MEKIVSLAKRRGFIFQGSEIYGGLGGTYSYGPLGVELKNNIKQLWWKYFIQERMDMVGIDGPIMLNPKLWEASGQVDKFGGGGLGDAMIDCKECKKRFRADHLIEEATGQDLEGELEAMTKIIKDKKIKCPNCNKLNWSDVRHQNAMFKTKMNGVEKEIYLRPETAGAIFADYKNVVDSTNVKIPFGIGQIGKAFRNEIVTGKNIFRSREFEQMEIEYFINPKKDDWHKVFDDLIDYIGGFAKILGLDWNSFNLREIPKDKRALYSKRTIDIEFPFPFGMKELWACAYRTDHDLSRHIEATGIDLRYIDQANGEKFIPHVVEPTFGVDRTVNAVIVSAYTEEKVKENTRVVLKFPKKLAPIKIAFLPLSKKEELSKPTKELFNQMKDKFVCQYDETQSIGKRYRRQDEIGTPYCVTFDFDSLKDKSVTVRDRDTMKQDRIKIKNLDNYFKEQYDK